MRFNAVGVPVIWMRFSKVRRAVRGGRNGGEEGVHGACAYATPQIPQWPASSRFRINRFCFLRSLVGFVVVWSDGGAKRHCPGGAFLLMRGYLTHTHERQYQPTPLNADSACIA